ncbi:TPM domain-containing protein [Candidatus Contubernalis alkaliaceticus]|uniref:TPM domain-containing protein n=1 Tax=Candidatus Contubernalis alkaliaceticus TaxID=338645 RepID=UPI001F4C29F7|nr:TPM domain-containing protein [Candidatus Contubernalis alkalaceticus]UNC91056.1 TPM domain-containing protein [Candidatus Contubernalis alkalaceticus]
MMSISRKEQSKRAVRQRSTTLLLIFLTVALLLVFAFSSTMSAAEQRVFDMAGLLTSEEVLQLEDRISQLKGELLMDIVVVTTNDAAGKTSRDYADDYYDDHGFGIGSEYDGLLLLLNMDHREAYISTTGIAIDYFIDARIESTLDDIIPYLADADYYRACTVFLDNVSSYVRAGIPEGQYRVAERDLSFSGRVRSSLSNSLVYILISMAVSALVVGIMASLNRGTIKTSSTTYLDEKSVNIISRRDRLINTNVTQAKIQSSSGSGGSGGLGSTTHRSSSGRTHGGGGRKF